MAAVTIETILSHTGVDFERVRLPRAQWTGNVIVGTGYWLRALYFGRRSGRMIAKFFSQWQQADGCQKGEYYAEITESDYLRYCLKAGVEPLTAEASEI